MIDDSRDTASEGGGVLSDEFASGAVTRPGAVGCLGNSACPLLAHPSVPQAALQLFAHQNLVLS